MTFGLRTPDPVGLFTDSILGADNPGAPAITITELTGEKRQVTLRGRALPYRPVAWASRMRTKLTWYQGSTVATQQVLGPELEPTIMNGVWKDRFMFGAEAGGDAAFLVNGSPDEVRSAESAAALMYQILQAGNTLRVVWGPEVRIGLLVAFEANYERRQDVAWRAEFQWQSRDESQVRAIEDPVGADDLLGAINGLDDILGFSPEDVARAFNAQLLDSIESVREKVGILFEALRTIEAVASIPQTVLGAIAAAVESIRLELTEEIGRLNESSVAGDNDDAGVSTTTRAAEVFSIEAYRRGVARLANVLRRIALAIDAQVQTRATPDAITVVPIPEDTSLYALSVRFYGTPDFATFLARANGLQSAVAPAGFSLAVPPRPAGGEAGDNPFC